MRCGAPEPQPHPYAVHPGASACAPCRAREMPSDRPFKQRRSFGEAQRAICGEGGGVGGATDLTAAGDVSPVTSGSSWTPGWAAGSGLGWDLPNGPGGGGFGEVGPGSAPRDRRGEP